MTTQQPEALRLADNLEANRCHQAARELRRLHAENEALKREIAATKPMDEVAAAKALCKHAAEITNVNFDDYWLIHSEEFKEEVRIVLDAAQAKQEEK